MRKQQFISILDRYLKNQATAEEQNILFAYYHLFMADADVLHLLKGAEKEKLKLQIKAGIDTRINTGMDIGTGHMIIPETSQPHHNLLWKRVAGVAAAVALITLGVWFYYASYISGRHPEFVSGSPVANDIKPGKNTATLTLANGRKILLSDAVNGVLAKESGVLIRKDASGRLYYEISPSSQKNPAATAFNTLSTARGETYQVKLSDGTHIWLNAASTLKYPASFASLKSRNVELTGEAYFEVAKDRLHPFFVKTARQQVEVVGTHFNVSSYRDDEGIKTTLLEGAVRIVAGGKSVLLNPGQESVVKQGVVEIAEVDTDEAIAWKNGYFNFNHEALGSIMNKISRWYDVEIQYDDPELKTQVFSGTVSRFKSVSLVLDKLELTDAVIFKISGKKIIVKKKIAKRT